MLTCQVKTSYTPPPKICHTVWGLQESPQSVFFGLQLLTIQRSGEIGNISLMSSEKLAERFKRCFSKEKRQLRLNLFKMNANLAAILQRNDQVVSLHIRKI
ncbi:hypothetical protein AMECASPLE_034779 [Ameca splendens]|uniref:Uncharacterized protein n=1 Tax=Ameca splendens TaxID=208324 RepID=A0ABV0YUY2_9TELE